MRRVVSTIIFSYLACETYPRTQIAINKSQMAYIGLPAGDPRGVYLEGADSYSRGPKVVANTFGPYSRTFGMDTMEAYERGPMGAHWPFEPSVEVVDRTDSYECFRSDIIDDAIKPYYCPLDLVRDSHDDLYFDSARVKSMNPQNSALLDEAQREWTRNRFRVMPMAAPTRDMPYGPTWPPKPATPSGLPMRIARPLGPLQDVDAQRGSLDAYSDRPNRFRHWSSPRPFHFSYSTLLN
jgi:hypothetical protein